LLGKPLSSVNPLRPVAGPPIANANTSWPKFGGRRHLVTPSLGLARASGRGIGRTGLVDAGAAAHQQRGCRDRPGIMAPPPESHWQPGRRIAALRCTPVAGVQPTRHCSPSQELTEGSPEVMNGAPFRYLGSASRHTRSSQHRRALDIGPSCHRAALRSPRIRPHHERIGASGREHRGHKRTS